MIPNEVKVEWYRLQEQFPVLQSWSLREDNRSTKRLGCCKYHLRVITMS